MVSVLSPGERLLSKTESVSLEIGRKVRFDAYIQRITLAKKNNNKHKRISPPTPKPQYPRRIGRRTIIRRRRMVISS